MANRARSVDLDLELRGGRVSPYLAANVYGAGY
jgi:hypothetical protein